MLAMFSALAPTCSIDAAISVIELDVSSAAVASSSALFATARLERLICSMADPTCVIETVSASLSSFKRLTEPLISTMAADTCSAAFAIWADVLATCEMERLIS